MSILEIPALEPPDPLEFFPAKPALLARSDSLGRRADPPKPYEEWETRDYSILVWCVRIYGLSSRDHSITLRIFFGGNQT